MPAMEPLCFIIGIDPKNFSIHENKLLEAELFIRICDELKEHFRGTHKEYFRLMKFDATKENTMIEGNFIRLMLNDILSTEEYNLQGIANYTDTHEDVIHELVSGINTKPLAICLRKVIELHRTVRRELYLSIGKKIASHYSDVA